MNIRSSDRLRWANKSTSALYRILFDSTKSAIIKLAFTLAKRAHSAKINNAALIWIIFLLHSMMGREFCSWRARARTLYSQTNFTFIKPTSTHSINNSINLLMRKSKSIQQQQNNVKNQIKIKWGWQLTTI